MINDVLKNAINNVDGFYGIKRFLENKKIFVGKRLLLKRIRNFKYGKKKE